MRVTSISLYSSNDVEIANLSFRDYESVNPYIAKEIVGLDADEIVPRFYAISLESNDKYFDLSVKSREIVLSIMLNPMYGESEKSYSDLRDDIYKAVASSRTGTMSLRLYDGFQEMARIEGFVTKMEYPHFTDAPEIKLTISCPDPMLRGPDKVNLSGSSLASISTLNVDDSTAPHGFQFQVTFVSVISNFIIKDPNDEWRFQIIPEIPFQIGTKLFFSSESGMKDLYMIQDSVKTYLVDKITTVSVWPILFPGSNTFQHNTVINWDFITYHPTYWGV